jgi:hypothetical protein
MRAVCLAKDTPDGKNFILRAPIRPTDNADPDGPD